MHDEWADHTQATTQASARQTPRPVKPPPPPATAKKSNKPPKHKKSKLKIPPFLIELNGNTQQKNERHQQLKALAKTHYERGNAKKRFIDRDVGATHGWLDIETAYTGEIVRTFHPFIGWLPIYKKDNIFGKKPTRIGHDTDITATLFNGDQTWTLTWDRNIEDTLPIGWTMTQHDEHGNATIITRNTLRWHNEDANATPHSSYRLLDITNDVHTPPHLGHLPWNRFDVTQQTWNKAHHHEQTALQKKWTIYIHHEEFEVYDEA